MCSSNISHPSPQGDDTPARPALHDRALVQARKKGCTGAAKETSGPLSVVLNCNTARPGASGASQLTTDCGQRTSFPALSAAYCLGSCARPQLVLALRLTLSLQFFSRVIAQLNQLPTDAAHRSTLSHTPSAVRRRRERMRRTLSNCTRALIRESVRAARDRSPVRRPSSEVCPGSKLDMRR